MKKLQVSLPDELHAKIKVLAALEGRDMTRIVRGLIEDYVEKAQKRKLIPVKVRN